MAAHHGEGHRPWYRSCRQKGIPVPVHMPIVEVGSIPSETGKSPRKAGEDSTMAGASWGLSDCTDRQFFKRFNWRQMSDFHSLHLQNLQKNGVGSTFQSSSGWDVRSSLAPNRANNHSSEPLPWHPQLVGHADEALQENAKAGAVVANRGVHGPQDLEEHTDGDLPQGMISTQGPGSSGSQWKPMRDIHRHAGSNRN